MGRPGENDKKHRNYKKEYADYHSKPEQIKKRDERNAARAAVEKRVGNLPSNVDVDHKTPIKNGGSSAKGNLRTISESQNSGWRKGQKGYKVGKV